MKRFCHNAEMFRMLLEMFLGNTPLKIKERREALAVGNRKQILLLVHKIKGTATTMGAGFLVNSLEVIEAASRDNDLEDMEGLVSSMESRYAELNNATDKLLVGLKG